MTPQDEIEEVDGTLDQSQSSIDSDGHLPDENPPPVQKRKGGRKPIYATAEERKQRNRQAQAAFRERRTEYIKQLEVTLKENETKLEEIQESHNSISEECQNLRRRNQVLEKLLADRGLNTQSELQTRGTVRSGSNSRSQNNARMMHQATMNRHNQVRRAPADLAPKLDTQANIEPPLSSPRTVATVESPIQTLSPESSMIISPTVHQHNSFSYPPQQQISPHVSPYSDSQAQFQGFDGQQFDRASFDYHQMPYNHHQSTASTPDTASPNIGQGSASFGYSQSVLHDRTNHTGKFPPFFPAHQYVELCSS